MNSTVVQSVNLESVYFSWTLKNWTWIFGNLTWPPCPVCLVLGASLGISSPPDQLLCGQLCVSTRPTKCRRQDKCPCDKAANIYSLSMMSKFVFQTYEWNSSFCQERGMILNLTRNRFLRLTSLWNWSLIASASWYSIRNFEAIRSLTAIFFSCSVLFSISCSRNCCFSFIASSRVRTSVLILASCCKTKTSSAFCFSGIFELGFFKIADNRRNNLQLPAAQCLRLSSASAQLCFPTAQWAPDAQRALSETHPPFCQVQSENQEKFQQARLKRLATTSKSVFSKKKSLAASVAKTRI